MISLELDRVSVFYPRLSRPALNAVSLQVAAGEVLALVGPNGAGKTSLIKVLCGLVQPAPGSSVRVMGVDALRKPLAARRLMGIALGVERGFYYRLTGYQNLLFFGVMDGLTAKEARSRAGLLLEQFGLRGAKDVPFMKYSLGMRKRLALARALLKNPPILLLDEPTANLDPIASRDVLSLIRDEASGGRAVLLATNRLRDAEVAADRVGFLKEGNLLTVKGGATARALMGESLLRLRLGREPTPPQLQALARLPGVNAVRAGNSTVLMRLRGGTADISPLLAELALLGLDIRQFTASEPTLEEVFREVVG